jgi:hypothetical protein
MKRQKKMMIPREGEYVYIPSSSKMMLFHDDNIFVKKTKILDKPVYVMYLGQSSQNCEFDQVFLDGQVWHTNKINIYPGKENE